MFLRYWIKQQDQYNVPSSWSLCRNIRCQNCDERDGEPRTSNTRKTAGGRFEIGSTSTPHMEWDIQRIIDRPNIESFSTIHSQYLTWRKTMKSPVSLERGGEVILRSWRKEGLETLERPNKALMMFPVQKHVLCACWDQYSQCNEYRYLLCWHGWHGHGATSAVSQKSMKEMADRAHQTWSSFKLYCSRSIYIYIAEQEWILKWTCRYLYSKLFNISIPHVEPSSSSEVTRR